MQNPPEWQDMPHIYRGTENTNRQRGVASENN